MIDNALRVKTAGYSATNDLTVSLGPCQCGTILDGVAFQHDHQGTWVLSYADLMTIADAATKRRHSASATAEGR